MHRCHINTERLLSGSPVLNREESRHLKTVLRVQPGMYIELFDGVGRTRRVSVDSVEKNAISVVPISEATLHPKPECAITLFACISKGKRMDWSVEKAVELGVSRIVPVISERTIVRLDSSERESKAERWRRVAADAVRQCGSAWMPEISMPLDFADTSSMITECSPVFTAALTENAVPLRDALHDFTTTPATAGWFVGPEGDFTEDELVQLRGAGTRFVSLGSNVLRAETASIYGLSVLGCAWL
jgi:16S rRNA (uracil1498-N3)-methyltransferase